MTALTAKRDALAAQADRMQKEIDDGHARLAAAEKATVAAQAALDIKRAKKRDWKATAHKYEQLWQSVRCSLDACRCLLVQSACCQRCLSGVSSRTERGSAA